jgi:hypothetical protein
LLSVCFQWYPLLVCGCWFWLGFLHLTGCVIWWQRTESPEGERITIQHEAQIHAEPRHTEQVKNRHPALYPLLPPNDAPRQVEETEPEPTPTDQQGIPLEAYGQQPSINPSFHRQSYVKMGKPLQLRANTIQTRRRTKSETAPPPTASNDYSIPPPSRPPRGPQPTTYQQTADSPYSVQPPHNNPTIIGLYGTTRSWYPKSPEIRSPVTR